MGDAGEGEPQGECVPKLANGTCWDIHSGCVWKNIESWVDIASWVD